MKQAVTLRLHGVGGEVVGSFVWQKSSSPQGIGTAPPTQTDFALAPTHEPGVGVVLLHSRSVGLGLVGQTGQPGFPGVAPRSQRSHGAASN